MLKKLIQKNRSYRRFKQNFAIKEKTLKELVDLARLSASAGNLQSLKYILSCEPKKNASIFKHLKWAIYLKDWTGPAEGERPAAYIVILGDTDINENFFCDHGIASQSILLGAVKKGLGGCILASIDRDGLRKTLGIPEKFAILLVIALGKPGEKVVIEKLPPDGSIRYWRDKNGVHHVPKRDLHDIIIDLKPSPQ
jgi:nitroreductase